MPKSFIDEAIKWLGNKYEEAEEDMLGAEGGSDYDYHWGRYEAYAHALDTIRSMANGTN